MTIEKAAKEAAARWFLSAENRDELAKEIVTHFAPIQKEMDDAREILTVTQLDKCRCVPRARPCIACLSKSWLSRNSKK